MHDAPVIESESGARSAKWQMHAVLVRVFDIGTLLIGESGIGKSECALDLVTRGHRLVADDAVKIFVESSRLVGKAPDLTRYLLEIRGLGIINVPELFGESAVCDRSEIDLCIELRKWTEATSNPLGDAIVEYHIAGGAIPKFVLPVSSGRNLATLVETAVRLYRNGASGEATERLIDQHAKLLDPIQ